MIEVITNATQSVITLLCGFLTAIFYFRTKKQAHFVLLCFYGCFGMAGLYWTLYLILYQMTPQVVLVSYIGWNISIAFLLILQYLMLSEKERVYKSHLSWIAVIVGVPVTTILCRGDDFFSQLISCIMVLLLAWFSLRGLDFACKHNNKKMKGFHRALLLFAFTELCLWVSAYFWVSDSMGNPYFWFDLLLSFSMIVIMQSVRKAVEA